MTSRKGFTIVEAIIAVAVVIILIIIILVLGRSIADPHFNYCDTFRYSSVRDVPVSCFNYLTNGDGSKQ